MQNSKKRKIISSRIREELAHRFKIKCAIIDCSQAKVIEKLIENFMEEEEEEELNNL